MKLQEIQAQLKAPKNQFNSFGKYKYRSCEDILEAVKPLLGDSVLTLSDEVKTTETVFPITSFENDNKLPSTSIFQTQKISYIESTATFIDGEKTFTVKSQAGVVDKKGMDIAQAFGAASSYARKYALNGMFLIDDQKDSDSEKPPKTEPKPENKTTPKQVFISAEQVKWVNTQISLLGIDRDAFKKHFELSSLNNITPALMPKVKAAIEQKAKAIL